MEENENTVAPQVSTLTKVYYGTTLTGERKHIAYVQEIPQLLSPKAQITYSALDIDDQRSAKGRREIQDLDIPFLYTEEQWDDLKAMADSDSSYWFFIQLPMNTAKELGKPITFYFKASIDLGMDTITIDEMLQSIVKIYRETEVKESKGFPTAE